MTNMNRMQAEKATDRLLVYRKPRLLSSVSVALFTDSAAGPAARGLVDLVPRSPGGENGHNQNHEGEGRHGRAQNDEGQLRGLHPAEALVQLKDVLKHAQSEVDAPAMSEHGHASRKRVSELRHVQPVECAAEDADASPVEDERDEGGVGHAGDALVAAGLLAAAGVVRGH